MQLKTAGFKAAPPKGKKHQTHAEHVQYLDNLAFTDEYKAVWDTLKDKLCTALILMHPDFSKGFILYCDGSKEHRQVLTASSPESTDPSPPAARQSSSQSTPTTTPTRAKHRPSLLAKSPAWRAATAVTSDNPFPEQASTKRSLARPKTLQRPADAPTTHSDNSQRDQIQALLTAFETMFHLTVDYSHRNVELCDTINLLNN